MQAVQPDPGAFDDRRILVLVASYRDPELPRTIASALTQAAYPEHVRFAICHQFDDETADCLAAWDDDPRFSVDSVHYTDSGGCCWARARTFDLYDDEPYILQIDAHTVFAPRWDVRYPAMMAAVDSDRPVFTTYPPAYRVDDEGTVHHNLDAGVQRLTLERLHDDLTTTQRTVPVDDLSVPSPSPLLAAGQLFTIGSFCRDVPYDPEMYFAGEEISLAVRAYTSGYDLFCPNENLVWHRYRHGGSLHWSDHHDHRRHHDRAIERLAALLVNGASLGRYGLGTARSLHEFEALLGVEFDTARRAGGQPTTPPSDATAALALDAARRRVVHLDRSRIEPRDDYRCLTLVVTDRSGTEIARREIASPDVLALARATIVLHGLDHPEATHCVVMPVRRDGVIGEVQILTLDG